MASFYKNNISTYESTCTCCHKKIKIGINIKYDYNNGNWRHLVCNVKTDVTREEHMDEQIKRLEIETSEMPTGEDTKENSRMNYIVPEESSWALMGNCYSWNPRSWGLY